MDEQLEQKLKLIASVETREIMEDAKKICQSLGLDPGTDLVRVAKLIQKQNQRIVEFRQTNNNDRV